MGPKDGEHPPELTKSQCRHVVVGVDAHEPWGRDQTTNSGASPRRGLRHASIYTFPRSLSLTISIHIATTVAIPWAQSSSALMIIAQLLWQHAAVQQ